MFDAIDKDNDVTAFATYQEAQAAIPPTGFDVIAASEKELAKATAEWPIGRFVEIWNSFAGVGDLKPVKKFENRAKATARIWTAIQKLGAQVEAAAVPASAADPTTAPAPAKKRAGKKPAAKKDASKARAARADATGWTPREGSQSAKVIALLKHKNGATLAEILAATGWQKHSVRGFISTLPKKTGLVITSTRRESDKARVYAAQ
jgi:hypothetical protein